MTHLPRIVPETGDVSYYDENGLTLASHVPINYRETNGAIQEVAPAHPLPVTAESDELWRIRKGSDSGGIIQKFGGRFSLTTSYAPCTTSGVYQTPQVSGATALRVKAGDADDTAAGTGAREITLQGLDETGTFTQESIATAGTSASAVTTTTWLRIFRLWVSASGTYATATAGSHADEIIIETSGGTEWASIDVTGFPKGQSQIACYTVPLNRHGYMTHFALTTNEGKPVDFILFKRENILETAAPYSAMRTVVELLGVENDLARNPKTAYGRFNALTDIGWLAKGGSTPNVTVDFGFVEYYE